MDLKDGEGVTRPAASAGLRAGDVVADTYRVDRLIGSGGMAEVYAGIDLRTNRPVALKWILPELAASREGLLRFRREALAVGRISHPNVVTTFDVVEHARSAILVMELLDGELLSDRLKRGGPLSFTDAVAILLPVMRGVAAAHAQGVIHRDLKPHNIFLCLDDRQAIRACKVLDFGVSKLTVADAFTLGDITLNGNLVGTPEYMAPEQIRAGRRIDHRIDVYALGVVLYEALAGRPPFVNRHFSGLMLEIMQNDPPALSTLRADVPPRLAAVIHRALAKDLGWRFPDVPSFIKELESVAREDLQMSLEPPFPAALPGAPTPAPSAPPSDAPSDPSLAPGSYLHFVVAAVVLLLGIATFVVAWAWGR